MDIDRIHVRSDVYGLSFFAENTYGEIGYRPNKSRFIRQREVLGLSLRIDTMNMRLGTTQVALSDLDLASNTGLQQDTNAITPVTTHLRVGRLQSNQSGQVAFLSGKTELHLGVKPAEQDKEDRLGFCVYFRLFGILESPESTGDESFEKPCCF